MHTSPKLNAHCSLLKYKTYNTRRENGSKISTVLVFTFNLSKLNRNKTKKFSIAYFNLMRKYMTKTQGI